MVCSLMPYSGAQASFIPLPRLWDNSLEKLRRRCHIDATEVITKNAVVMFHDVYFLCIDVFVVYMYDVMWSGRVT